MLYKYNVPVNPIEIGTLVKSMTLDDVKGVVHRVRNGMTAACSWKVVSTRHDCTLIQFTKPVTIGALGSSLDIPADTKAEVFEQDSGVQFSVVTAGGSASLSRGSSGCTLEVKPRDAAIARSSASG